MPSFIAQCSFILPPLLHSFFDHRLTESVQKVFQLSRDKYSVKPPTAISSRLLGLLINENPDNQG